MPKVFWTHYDNLKVSRDAPPQVINAAYRALCKQHHPDINKDYEKSEKVMAIVNGSYAVLSDPAKRMAHDQWIRLQESEVKEQNDVEAPIPLGGKVGFIRHLRSYGLTYAFFAALIGWYALDSSQPKQSGLPPYIANPSPQKAEAAPEIAKYSRPDAAPNGKPWPSAPSYVAGYPIARRDGLSSLTIDNSANSSDVFVKLVALGESNTVPIRHVYIPASQTFKMEKVRAGTYDVRYQDLEDGSLARSESFVLQEIEEINGTSFSNNTITLYKVQNGNFQTFPLSPSEF